MKKFFVPLLFVGLTACPAPLTPPSSADVELAVNRAVLAESTSQLRCPKSNAERFALQVIRSEFDNRYGMYMTVAQGVRLSAARDSTNRLCGL